MKNALLLILALFVAAPVTATDDDKPVEKPTAVEVLPPQEIKLEIEPLATMPEPSAVNDEEPGCFAQTRGQAMHLVPYTLIVGIALELPADINFAGALGGVIGAYAGCHVERAIKKKR